MIKPLKTHTHKRQDGEGFSLRVRLVPIPVPGESEENGVNEERYPREGDAEDAREGMAEYFATGIKGREITERGETKWIDVAEIVGLVTQVRRITESNDRKNNNGPILFHMVHIKVHL
jgi:hypothetical protein